ncbi:hypothetical protein [Streptomyces sp. NPDC051561]|uniref:hypothetical protein n=1 Tax=Streptomyces sp. NPDC051561 TaxID=3365658 RepID=UPI0037B92EE5
MDLSQSTTLIACLATVSAAVIVVIASLRTNTAKVWREEAEAQKERADRLAGDLTEIKNRLARIESENARLIGLLTALDPARLSLVRLTQED